MKKLGIIGGMGLESTIEYYKKIMYQYQTHNSQGKFANIVIDSVDIYSMLKFCKEKDYSGLKNFLSESVNNIYKAGATVGIIASNTPHIVFEELKKVSPIPLLSIVEETFKEIKNQNCVRVGLMGTKFTMQENFYKNIFIQNNIKIFTPKEIDQEYINKKIFEELEFGVVKGETKNNFIKIINDLKIQYNLDGIILGCAELPMIIKDDDIDMKIFNTTDIHINSIVKYMLEFELGEN
jgi:aspartate racemase